MGIFGSVKEIVTILLAVLIFQDQVGFLNLLGLFIAMIGTIWYKTYKGKHPSASNLTSKNNKEEHQRRIERERKGSLDDLNDSTYSTALDATLEHLLQKDVDFHDTEKLYGVPLEDLDIAELKLDIDIDSINVDQYAATISNFSNSMNSNRKAYNMREIEMVENDNDLVNHHRNSKRTKVKTLTTSDFERVQEQEKKKSQSRTPLSRGQQIQQGNMLYHNLNKFDKKFSIGEDQEEDENEFSL